MDFETIVPFLAVALWIAITILKRRKARQSGSTKKTSGWRQKVEGVITQIRDEIEAQKTGSKGPSAGTHPMTPPPETVWEKNQDVEFPPPMPLEEEVEEEEVLLEESAMPAKVRKKAVPYRSGISVKKLRSAIVWSEILAQPVGLREE